MSGGSMDYLYYKVMEAEFKKNTTLRKAFFAHLQKVASALRAIEWNDSGDGDDKEEELIRACLSTGAELEILIEEAKIVCRELVHVIEQQEKK